MPAARLERFAQPTGIHDRRVLSWTRAVAIDALGERTVWCAAALPAGRAAAERLCRRLSGELDIRTLPVPAPESLATPADYAAASERADAFLGDRVAAGDVVVLHDALALPLAEPAREREAHVVRRIPAGREFREPPGRAVDATVVAWIERPGPVEHLAASLPSAQLIDVKEAIGAESRFPIKPRALLWGSILADVLELDRANRVGGTVHARPAVAPR